MIFVIDKSVKYYVHVINATSKPCSIINNLNRPRTTVHISKLLLSTKSQVESKSKRIV